MNVLRRSVRRRVGERMRRSLRRSATAAVGLAVAVPVLATVSAAPAVAAPDDGILRVLLFYKSSFHASHVEARAAVRQLSAELAVEYDQELQIIETDQASSFTPEILAQVDTLAFMQTGGQLFNDAQRDALEDYIRGGGGWMGQHYAAWSFNTQSEHDVNPFYAQLVGATSDGHPEGPAIRVGEYVVEDLQHPLTQGLQERTTHEDEWYDWNINPAQNVRTLVTADEATYATDATGGRQGTFHPITWCQEIDAGRSWYSGLGHDAGDYAQAGVRTQMKNGLAYTAGLLPADCSPPNKEEQGSWSGVTPWPLMPINASLTSDGTVQSFGSIATGCTDATPYDWTGNTCIDQGGDMEVDIWDPSEPRTLDNLRDGIIENTTYTDLFCSMQVQDPNTGATVTVGGDDGLGGNAPNDAAPGVTSYTTNNGLQTEAPMNLPRWYPTGTTMPNGDIVVQGGSEYGGPGGPGILTPELRTPEEGSGWKTLDGARSAAAYGDGQEGGPDENRWWYPRAFVTPGTGELFNVTGTQMYELDPYGNDGEGELTLRGRVPAASAAQGTLGNPVGATSTATMYRPGQILQVGGGWWGNGGGPNGARAGFTVDITGPGGAAAPVVTPTAPMKFQRHWASSTVLPDGDVLITGGGRENNGRDDTVTNAEIWNPDTGEWTEVEVPHERARLYHSTALLLPDGRVMIGGGGAPGPRNYTDVEYYSPAYLFDGDAPATRPVVTNAPEKVEYDDTFQLSTTADVERVTLVRNGSVTHGFNNDQNFQELEFSQSGSSVSVESPVDGTYAPPGSYMVFVWDADGTPSLASMVDIDPVEPADVRTPQVVEQFEYPRFVDQPTATVPAGGARMAPWSIERPVQLVRAIDPSQRGLSRVGYHLGLGTNGALERELTGLDVGREYRISMRYARDSRSTSTAPASAELSVGDLIAPLSSTTASNGDAQTASWGTYVDTFTASARTETLRLSASGAAAAMMIDDLVVIGSEPGVDDVPVHYEFEEGVGTSAANTGADGSVGAATLTGTTTWTENGVFGGGIDLLGGASNANAVDLPDNVLQGATDFSTSFWVRPDAQPSNWTGLFHIGTGLGGTGGYFQIQTETRVGGDTGLAATFKAPGAVSPTNPEERIFATPSRDLVLNQWNHVAFTRTGSTGTLFLNGVAIATRSDLTVDLAEVGATTESNWLGRNGFPDAPFDGQLDEVRLYEAGLSATDVAALYADGSALGTTTTVSVAPVSPSPFGEPLTVSARVTAGTTPATGSAQLIVDGAPQGAPVDVVDGAVSFPAVTLTRGEHELEVRFTAREGFRDSVGTTTHTVDVPPPGTGVSARYAFDEGTGTTSANSGDDGSIGPATLTGATGWTPDGRFGAAVSMPGGAAATNNQVRLPDNITAGMDEELSVSMWLRPDNLPNWVSHLQIGKNTEEFFLVQSSTENGERGLAATLRVNNGEQYRIQLPGDTDVPIGAWTHVVVTLGPSPSGGGTTGKIYLNGELVPGGTRNNIPVDIGDVGDGGTTANFLGGTSWPDPRYDGLSDEFQLFGYELTAAQVAELTEGPDVEPPANTAPVAVGDSYTTDEGVVLTVPAPGVLGNDTDADGDPLTAVATTQPVHGEVALAADGSFDYTPDAGFSGIDTFAYTASDESLASAPATVSITVEPGEDPDPDPDPTNSAPVAMSEVYVTDQGATLTLDAPGVLANDTDADDDTLTATGLVQPEHGIARLRPDGSFVYIPDDDFLGLDSFGYRASDGTALSQEATVTIAVAEVPPAATVMVGSADPVTFGARGTVSVQIAPSEVTGRVVVSKGSQRLGSAAVNRGRATVALPAKSLRPGRHELVLSYAGDDSHAASSTTTQIVVRKVTPTLRVEIPSRIEQGTRATLRVQVGAKNVAVAGSTVQVSLNGGRSIVGTVRGGRVSFRLPPARQLGRLNVQVVYLGNDLVARATTRTTSRVVG